MPGGSNLDLVDWLSHRVMFGRRLQEPKPLSLFAPEQAIVVRVPGQREDPGDFAPDQDGVVDRQIVPARQPDACLGRVVIAKRHLGLGQRFEHGAGQDPPLVVRDLDDRVDGRSKSTTKNLDDQTLPFLRREPEVIDIPAAPDPRRDAPGSADPFSLRRVRRSARSPIGLRLASQTTTVLPPHDRSRKAGRRDLDERPRF